MIEKLLLPSFAPPSSSPMSAHPKERGAVGEDSPMMVLIVDDEELLTKSCAQILSSEGFQVFTEGRGINGLKIIRDYRPEIVITDLMLPDMDGLTLLKECRKINPDALVIMITGFATVDSSVEAFRAGAFEYVPKPFTATQLRLLVGRAAHYVRNGESIQNLGFSSLEQLLLEENELLKAELRKHDGRQQGFAAPELYRVLLLYILHDLRNAMESIRVSADLLVAGDVPGDYLHPTYEGIAHASRRAAELVQKVFSVVDEVPALFEPVRIYQLAREVAAEARALLPPGVRLVLSRVPRDGGDLYVRANSYLLKLIFRELLRNAVNAVAPGSGVVRILVDPGLEKVKILIRDNGPGIPSYVLARLDAVRERRTLNLSSGLPLSLRLLEEMDGSLAVESTGQRGTTVSVTLQTAIGHNAV